MVYVVWWVAYGFIFQSLRLDTQVNSCYLMCLFLPLICILMVCTWDSDTFACVYYYFLLIDGWNLCELLRLDTHVTEILILVFIIAFVHRDTSRKEIVFLFVFRLHRKGWRAWNFTWIWNVSYRWHCICIWHFNYISLAYEIKRGVVADLPNICGTLVSYVIWTQRVKHRPKFHSHGKDNNKRNHILYAGQQITCDLLSHEAGAVFVLSGHNIIIK